MQLRQSKGAIIIYLLPVFIMLPAAVLATVMLWKGSAKIAQWTIVAGAVLMLAACSGIIVLFVQQYKAQKHCQNRVQNLVQNMPFNIPFNALQNSTLDFPYLMSLPPVPDHGPQFFTYNPCVFLQNSQLKAVVRVSNFTLVTAKPPPPYFSFSYVYDFASGKYTDLFTPAPAGHNCATASAEDLRMISSTDDQHLLAVANIADHACTAKQWLLTYNKDLKLLSSVKLLADFAPPNSFEKNWMPFFYNGSLHMVYSVDPHIVMQVDSNSGTCTTLASTSCQRAHDMFLRGGALWPHPYKGYYFGVVHSAVPYRSAIYAFDAHPPFSIKKMTNLFTFAASDMWLHDQKHSPDDFFEEFAMGCTLVQVSEVGDFFVFSLGVQDARAMLAIVRADAVLSALSDA